jgi:hypothetical protein
MTDHRRAFTGLWCLAVVLLLCSVRQQLIALVRNPTVNWGLSRIDQPDRALALAAQQLRYVADGTTVNIFIVGTGVAQHSEFGTRLTYIGDFCTGDRRAGTVEVDPEDGFDGHDTHVASYAAGTTTGVAKNAKIYSLRTTYSPSNDPGNGGSQCANGGQAGAVAAAINWIKDHGHEDGRTGPGVVNYSGGFGGSDVRLAIKAATIAGYFFTLSGNTGNGTVESNWGSCSQDPSCVPNIALVVGGTRDTDVALAPASNYGSYLGLYAPAAGLIGAGKSGGLTKPEDSSPFYPGDSFAAPWVAGVAAVFRQQHKSASPAQVRAAILKRTVNVGPAPPAAPQKLLQMVRDNVGDYNSDGRADLWIWRTYPGPDAQFYVLKSSDPLGYSGQAGIPYGLSTDIPVVADYDGDGVMDPAIFRNGTWTILTSSSQFQTYQNFTWGAAGDVPVPGDYDGDGIVDPAVFRPGSTANSAIWFILFSATNYTTSQTIPFGDRNDKPVPADYDGDSRTDVAQWTPGTGTWSVLGSGCVGGLFSCAIVPNGISWGSAAVGDIAVPGDYDGDGKADPAVYRPGGSSGWWILSSLSGYVQVTTPQKYWGTTGDVPVPGDYDGDGKTDYAVWRPSDGTWWLWYTFTNSQGTGSPISWGGVLHDTPLPASGQPVTPR